MEIRRYDLVTVGLTNMRTFWPFCKPDRRHRRERGSMLLELLIAMVVLLVGLGGLLSLLVSSLYTNNSARNDTTSTMLAEHVIEQISAEPANSSAALTITDCAGTAWDVETAPALQGAGSGGANGGNGAGLTSSGIVDWTQTYSTVPDGYKMRYVSCGADGSQMVYDVRWNVLKMSTSDYTRMVIISARPNDSTTVGGLHFIVPVNLRTIGGM
jgi:type II secretory pathway pseudopilin PulG